MNNITLKNGHELFIDGQRISPAKSQAAYNHSPDGFSWGYGGSGPSQAALAIMMEFTDQDTAVRIYQDFKWQHVCQWREPDMEIFLDIPDWIELNRGEI